MASPVLPGFSKIWQLNVNNVASYSEGGTIDNQKVLLNLKNLIIGFTSNPWTVVSSSDSVTSGNTDLWIKYTDLVWSTSNHSWIVLQKPNSKSQILFSLDVSSSANMNISWSPQGLFTGGTTSTNPTAIDEIILQSNKSWNGGLTTYDAILHTWHTSDGSCTRIVVSNDTSEPKAFFIFDTITSLVSGWSQNTDIICLYQNTGAMSYTYNSAEMVKDPVTSNFAKAWSGHKAFDISIWSWGHDAPPLANSIKEFATNQEFGEVGNELITNKPYPIVPLGVASSDSGSIGVLGYMSDMYAGHTILTSGTTYPDSTTTKKWAQFNDIILPWTNDSKIPLSKPIITFNNVPDKSVNNNDGTPTNMGKVDFSTIGVAGTFSTLAATFSTNKYIAIGNVTELAFDRTDAFSISAWFKTTETSNTHTLVSKMQNSPLLGYEIIMDATSGVIIFELVNTSTTNHMRIDTINSYNDGYWHNVITTWDGDVAGGANGAKIYIDGSEVTTSTAADTLSGSITTTVGFQISGKNGLSTVWEGSIDDVAVYNKELTSTDVTTIYNSGIPNDLRAVGPTSNLVGYWLMGEDVVTRTNIENTVNGIALVESGGATETIIYVMGAIDEGGVGRPYHYWKVQNAPDPTGSQTTPPSGIGPLSNIHISSTYTII